MWIAVTLTLLTDLSEKLGAVATTKAARTPETVNFATKNRSQVNPGNAL